MKKFIGKKEINAKPMTRQEYNDFRGWDLPTDENGEDEGYLVEYTDGGKANTDQYKGYVSWSPKDVFEISYKPSETPLDRLLIERAELSERLEKLKAFTNNSTECVNKVGEEQYLALLRQGTAMQWYLDELTFRINLMK